MTKPTTQSQGAFSFLDEVEKTMPLPKPKKNMLRPPTQIEVNDKDEDALESEKTTLQEPVAGILEAKIPEKEIALPVGENPEKVAIEAEAQWQDTVEESRDNVAEEKKSISSRGRRSVKENSLAADNVEMPDDEVLFQKHYYSMGDVTAMFKENHSLIRYWESEFDILKPKKNGKGDRFFRPADVKNLFLIYDLLRRRKFTIEGAKEYLKNNNKADEKFAAVQSLQKIKSFFLELKSTL